MARDAMLIEREWVGVVEAEILTGRSRWSWRRDAYSGKIGSAKVGRRLLLRLGSGRGTSRKSQSSERKSA